MANDHGQQYSLSSGLVCGHGLKFGGKMMSGIHKMYQLRLHRFAYFRHIQQLHNRLHLFSVAVRPSSQSHCNSAPQALRRQFESRYRKKQN